MLLPAGIIEKQVYHAQKFYKDNLLLQMENGKFHHIQINLMNIWENPIEETLNLKCL